MTNQNSKCCGAKVAISDLGHYNGLTPVCTNCETECDIVYTPSKSEEKTGKGLVKCDRCRQIKPVGLVLENITDVNCGKGLCIDCSKDAYDFTHMRSSPRLENWEERFEEFFGKNSELTRYLVLKYGGILHHEAIFKELKSFISTLLQEERGKFHQLLEDMKIDTTTADSVVEFAISEGTDIEAQILGYNKALNLTQEKNAKK